MPSENRLYWSLRNSQFAKSVNSCSEYDCCNCVYLINFRNYRNISIELSFGKPYAHTMCTRTVVFHSHFFFSFEFSLKFFCSRNNQFSFVHLYNKTPINTISRRSFDVEQGLNQQSPSQSSTSHHLVYSDPPPAYDEIVLDIRLTNTNSKIGIVY